MDYEDRLQFYIVMETLKALEPFERGLRWSKIRDACLTRVRYEKIEIPPSKMPNFNMKVTRQLEKMVSDEIFKKKNLGHKQTYYSLVKESLYHYFQKYPKILNDERFVKGFLEDGSRSKNLGSMLFTILFTVRGLTVVSEKISHLSFEEDYLNYKSIILEAVEEFIDPEIQRFYERDRETYVKVKNLLKNE